MGEETASPQLAPIGLLLALCTVALFVGCAHAPLNAPLARALTQAEVNRERPLPADKVEGLDIVVSFSGGGVRAAALAYGALQTLAQTELPTPAGPRRLLDQIDLITAVSGGSFTAAYYGLYGERIFSDFEPQFLNGRIGRSILLRLLAPWNWIRLASGRFDRTDVAAEVFDDRLFHGATFADIDKHPGPLIAIQATDLIEGTRFGFSAHTFALICSDIMQYPLARAVAASAAVPVLFSPIAVRNYAGSCDYREPAWIGEALSEGPGAGRRYENAKHFHAYADAAARPWIYLSDGALADNLGLHRVFDAVANRKSLHELLRVRGVKQLRRIAFVIVNAEVPPTARWESTQEAPGTLAMLDTMAGVQMNRYSFESVELLRRNIADWSQEFIKAGEPPFEAYVIEVGFDQLRDEAERRSFAGIPTTYDLPAAEIDRLREAAHRILSSSAEYQRLVHDLGGRIIDW